MELHDLKPAPNSVKSRKRVGRGQGTGIGGTSKRGHNGAKSRSGYKRKLYREGGQNPLQMRLPKFGYMNTRNRTSYKAINLDTIQILAEKKNLNLIDRDALIDSGLISKKDNVKLLGRGEIKAKVDISVDAVSQSAQKSVESAGGTVKINK